MSRDGTRSGGGLPAAGESEREMSMTRYCIVCGRNLGTEDACRAHYEPVPNFFRSVPGPRRDAAQRSVERATDAEIDARGDERH